MVSLIVFLHFTKTYIDSYDHLFVVMTFVVLLIVVNHFTEVVECFVNRIDNVIFVNECSVNGNGCSKVLNWIINDYQRSKTKRVIDRFTKYFLSTIQNIDGDKT